MQGQATLRGFSTACAANDTFRPKLKTQTKQQKCAGILASS